MMAQRHTDEADTVEQYVSATEAIRMLKTTRETMRKWLESGVLSWTPNPGDKRKKMIPLREVLRLKLIREEGKMAVPKARPGEPATSDNLASIA